MLRQRQLLLGLALLHTVAVFRLFGRSLVDGDSILASFDWSHHSANVTTARQLWTTAGSLSGFSPTSMAGFPFGTADSVSNRLGELVAAILPLGEPAQVLAWLVMTTLVLTPWTTVMATRPLGGPGTDCWAFAFGAALVWRAVEGPRPFVLYGMYGFVLASALAPWAVCLLALGQEGRRSRRVGRATVAVVAVAVGWACHILFPLLILPGLGALIARGPWRQGTPRTLAPLAIALTGGLVALPLWLPLWLHRSDLRAAGSHFFQDSWSAALVDIRSLWVLLWVAAAAAAWRDRPTTITTALATSGFGAIGFALLSPLSQRLGELQPARFLEAAGFALAPLAAWAISNCSRGSTQRLLGVAAILWLLPTALTAGRHAMGGGEPLLVWQRQSTDPRLALDVRELPGHLRRWSSPEGRVLIEESSTWSAARPTVWGNLLLPALLPHLIGREVIGGPLPDSRLRHAHTGFLDGVAFGRPIGQWRDDQLDARLDGWNVDLVVVWSAMSRADAERRPRLEKVDELGRFHVFRVRNPRHCFAQLDADGTCPAATRATPGRIEVRPHRPGMLVLSWHWASDLHTDGAVLERHPLLDDPFGVISATSGGRAFAIISM